MKIVKRISTVVCVMLLTSGLVSALEVEERLKLVSLSVPTMNCVMCPITVSKSLTNIEGVQVADANLEKGIVKVTFNDQVTDVDALLVATKMAGYPSYLIKK